MEAFKQGFFLVLGGEEKAFLVLAAITAAVLVALFLRSCRTNVDGTPR